MKFLAALCLIVFSFSGLALFQTSPKEDYYSCQIETSEYEYLFYPPNRTRSYQVSISHSGRILGSYEAGATLNGNLLKYVWSELGGERFSMTIDLSTSKPFKATFSTCSFTGCKYPGICTPGR